MNSEHEEWMTYLHKLSKNSPCGERKTAAALVKGGCLISDGYNSVPYDSIECSEANPCHKNPSNVMFGERCPAIHAEEYAIINAARKGISTVGSTMYCTHSPCRTCAFIIVAAGVCRLIFEQRYSDKFVMEYLKSKGVEVYQLQGERLRL